MSRTLRLAGAMALACGTVPLLGVGTAHADTVAEPGAVGAYFYSAGIDKPEQAPAPPPNVTGTGTDFVAEGHLPVAVRVPNQVDKMSFISFDLDTVPFDATITKAIVTLPLAEDTVGDPRTSNDQRSPAPQKVRACAAGPEGFNGEDGQSFAQAPSVDCETFTAPATESADKKSYVFDISGLAATWLTGSNNGVAFVPTEEGLASEFQVVFLPVTESMIAVDFTLPPTEVEVLPPSVDTAPPLVFSGGSTDVGSGFTGGADLGTGSVPGPQPAPAPAPAPQAAPAAAAPQATTPVASTAMVESLRPTALFWVLGAAFAALLALLSRIMGDTRVAAPSAAAASPLARSLRDRRTPGTTSGSRGLSRTRPLSI